MLRRGVETPDTDQAWSELGGAERARVWEIDHFRLEEERARVAPWVAQRLEESTHSVRNRFRNWEYLIRIMSRWGPGSHYMVEEYVNDLETRDALDADISSADSGILRDLLRVLDEKFFSCTVFDGGHEIESKYRRLTYMHDRTWIWDRRPARIPWN